MISRSPCCFVIHSSWSELGLFLRPHNLTLKFFLWYSINRRLSDSTESLTLHQSCHGIFWYRVLFDPTPISNSKSKVSSTEEIYRGRPALGKADCSFCWSLNLHPYIFVSLTTWAETTGVQSLWLTVSLIRLVHPMKLQPQKISLVYIFCKRIPRTGLQTNASRW